MTVPTLSPALAAPITAETTAAVDAAMLSRRSIRAFLPTPVAREVIEDILAVAARAPSGTNTQPWQVHVLTGASLQAMADDIVATHNNPEERARHSEEYAYYPTQWQRPTSTAAARWAGTCMRSSASRRPTRRACTPSTAATTPSSVRRWA